MILMCGSQHIKPELLSKQLAFRGWPVASKTPQMLIDLIHNMSQVHLPVCNAGAVCGAALSIALGRTSEIDPQRCSAGAPSGNWRGFV